MRPDAAGNPPAAGHERGQDGQDGPDGSAARETLPVLTPDWPALPNVSACVTTRHGGCSAAPFGAAPFGADAGAGAGGGLNLGFHTGDDPHAVATNRARVQAHVGGRTIAWLDQVHGTDVIDAAVAATAPVPPRADALVTDRADVVCAIMVADCLPVLLGDRDGRAVGAAHAGWRGLCGGVIERTVEAMARLTRGAPLQAYLGPAIGPLAFEVGAEVRAAFLDAAPPEEREASMAAFVALPVAHSVAHSVTTGAVVHPPKFRADLAALARLRLLRAGVAASAIHGGNACTWTDADRFFSYRRDGRTGRFAALIWRESSAGKP
ncbi:peptidoglycan editing factor PgeF [Robbsia sp. Bb-Pol-6]|uniref:Purine nucleoside phosphorylase n=1 Tax=Robbsia betulipollinis TaxID=2981849 RepID=A0ABT3ZNF0_9BURK|nr:peptidoglycan editing factor PgeF [Robbsia betulipollinis]MCY0388064.1 peptidoglycan editing factor PgeF [Robbsia betulipollinis]